jgi:hypothetical protein
VVAEDLGRRSAQASAEVIAWSRVRRTPTRGPRRALSTLAKAPTASPRRLLPSGNPSSEDPLEAAQQLAHSDPVSGSDVDHGARIVDLAEHLVEPPHRRHVRVGQVPDVT